MQQKDEFEAEVVLNDAIVVWTDRARKGTLRA